MRRTALLGLLLLLSGCSNVGFFDFFTDTNTPGRNVNAPIGDSENLRRVRGLSTNVPPLGEEPGNVWPGPIPEQPTLETLEQQRGSNAPDIREGPVPGAPDYNPPGGPSQLPPQRPQGSSTPPGSNLPPLARPGVPSVPPGPGAAPPPPANGPVLQTPRGPAVPTGNGSRNFQQYQGVPGSGQPGGILIPNGNGTSTLVHPDGSVETVPSPGR